MQTHLHKQPEESGVFVKQMPAHVPQAFGIQAKQSASVASTEHATGRI